MPSDDRDDDQPTADLSDEERLRLFARIVAEAALREADQRAKADEV